MKNRIRVNGKLYEATAREESINVIKGWSATVFADAYGRAYNRKQDLSVFIRLEGEPEDFMSIGNPKPAPYTCDISTRSASVEITFYSADAIEDITAEVVEITDESIKQLINNVSKDPLMILGDYTVDNLRTTLTRSIERSFKNSFSKVSKATY